MENLNHGQTSPQASDSSESHANQLHASGQAAANSGADPALDATNAATNAATKGATNATDNAASNEAQNSSSASSGAGPKASETSGSADQSAKSAQPDQSAVSKAAGGHRLGMRAVLPGESSENYIQGLTSAIEELGAKSHTQVYFAEKFFQCLWAMNRYEVQKRASLNAEMLKALKDDFGLTPEERRNVTILLQEGMWDTPGIQNMLKARGFTNSSLTQRAMERRMQELMQLDQLIALKAHTLSAIQKTYEALVSRPVMQERLKLQNDLLKRDLQAIGISEVVGDSGLPDEQVASVAQETSQQFKDSSKSVVRKSTIAATAINQGREQEGLAPSDVVPKDAVPKDAVSRDAKSKSPPRPKGSVADKDQNDL